MKAKPYKSGVFVAARATVPGCRLSSRYCPSSKWLMTFFDRGTSICVPFLFPRRSYNARALFSLYVLRKVLLLVWILCQGPAQRQKTGTTFPPMSVRTRTVTFTQHVVSRYDCNNVLRDFAYIWLLDGNKSSSMRFRPALLPSIAVFSGMTRSVNTRRLSTLYHSGENKVVFSNAVISCTGLS